jgi:hypothetical protein
MIQSDACATQSIVDIEGDYLCRDWTVLYQAVKEARQAAARQFEVRLTLANMAALLLICCAYVC